MALSDLFKSKEKKQEELLAENKSFLNALLYMAVCDDKLDEWEFKLIQELMFKKGIDREVTAKEIERKLTQGEETSIKMPTTDQEKEDFFVYLTTMMIVDNEIHPKEMEFVTLIVSRMYGVDKETAQAMVVKLVKQMVSQMKQ